MEIYITSSDNQPLDIPGVTSPCDLSDVTFLVDTRLLYSRRVMLMGYSPVFKAMFSNDHRERTQQVIPLPEKTYNDVSHFLACIQGRIRDISRKYYTIIWTPFLYNWTNHQKFVLRLMQLKFMD